MKVEMTVEEFIEWTDGVTSVGRCNRFAASMSEETSTVNANRDKWLRAAGEANDKIVALDADLTETNRMLEAALAKVEELKIAAEAAEDIWVDPDDEIELLAVKEDRDEWEGRARDLAKRIKTVASNRYELPILAENVAREAKAWGDQ